jgi:hypothetical protein
VICCPPAAGAADSAQGFNAGNPERSVLKGRQNGPPNKLEAGSNGLAAARSLWCNLIFARQEVPDASVAASLALSG